MTDKVKRVYIFETKPFLRVVIPAPDAISPLSEPRAVRQIYRVEERTTSFRYSPFNLQRC